MGITTREVKKQNKYYRPNTRSLPYKYSPDAQAERNWEASRSRDGENFMYNKHDKEKYRSNYDEIEWSK